MAAAKLNLTCEQGTKFERMLTIAIDGTPVDLTGYTVRGKIKKYVTDAAVVATFTFTIQNQVTDTGKVLMSLPAATSTAFVIDPQQDQIRSLVPYAYDVELVPASGDPTRIFQGIFFLSPEVTT